MEKDERINIIHLAPTTVKGTPVQVSQEFGACALI